VPRCLATMGEYGDVLAGLDSDDEDLLPTIKMTQSTFMPKDARPIAHSLPPAKFAVIQDDTTPVTTVHHQSSGLSQTRDMLAATRDPRGSSRSDSPTSLVTASSEASTESSTCDSPRATYSFRNNVFGSTRVILAPECAIRSACIDSFFGGELGDPRSCKIFGKGIIWLTKDELCIEGSAGRLVWPLEGTTCKETERYTHDSMDMAGLGKLFEIEGPCSSSSTMPLAKGAKRMHMGVTGLGTTMAEWVEDIGLQQRMLDRRQG